MFSGYQRRRRGPVFDLGHRDLPSAGPLRAEVSSRISEQRSMHQEVGVTSDRRGEMGVAAQRQAKTTDIVRIIGGLRLAAQDEVIDQHGLPGAGGAAQHAIEQLRLYRLPFG